MTMVRVLAGESMCDEQSISQPTKKLTKQFDDWDAQRPPARDAKQL